MYDIIGIYSPEKGKKMTEKTVEDIVTNITKARAALAPHEAAFMEVFKTYHDTVKDFVKKKKWYTSESAYSCMSQRYFSISDVEIDADNRELCVNVADKYEDPFGEDYVSISYDELVNPTPYLEAAYAEYKAKRDANTMKFKADRKRELERQLAELDN